MTCGLHAAHSAHIELTLGMTDSKLRTVGMGSGIIVQERYKEKKSCRHLLQQYSYLCTD